MTEKAASDSSGMTRKPNDWIWFRANQNTLRARLLCSSGNESVP